MGRMDWRSSERLRSRRPIADGEVQLLEELGRAIVQARGSTGLSRRALAESALMHPTSIARIEYGTTRKTLASTLKRIARALAAKCDDLDADSLVESWVRLGGRAIAPGRIMPTGSSFRARTGSLARDHTNHGRRRCWSTGTAASEPS